MTGDRYFKKEVYEMSPRDFLKNVHGIRDESLDHLEAQNVSLQKMRDFAIKYEESLGEGYSQAMKDWKSVIASPNISEGDAASVILQLCARAHGNMEANLIEFLQSQIMRHPGLLEEILSKLGDVLNAQEESNESTKH